MTRQVALNDEDVRLVLDLLENEQRELPAEIHHTDNFQVRQGLHQRLRLVETLIARFRSQQEPVAAK